MRNQLPFYASPDEQTQWIEQVVADPDMWCWIQDRYDYAELTHVDAIAQWFGRDSGWQIFAGHRDITPGPVWRTVANGRRTLEVWESQAVQFLPSIYLNEQQILLQGRLARAISATTTRFGKDDPLEALFRRLRSDIRARWQCSSNVLIVHYPGGSEKPTSDVCVSARAAEFWRDGVRLKQVPKSTMQYSVRSPN